MKSLSFLTAAVLLIIATVASSAHLANNTVGQSHTLKRVTTRTLPELLPPECSSSSVTAYVMGLTGTAAGELVMATSAAETVNSAGGNDCVMGGSGNDTINGGAGAADICIGGPGIDTFSGCETQIQ